MAVPLRADTWREEDLEENFPESQRKPIQRTPLQNRTAVEHARIIGQGGNAKEFRIPTPANDTSESAEQEQGQSSQINAAQDRVQNRRFINAQVILASQEEVHNQIAREEDEKPSLVRYTPALGVAFVKDFLLDPTGFGSLPVIGTIVTFICSIIIFILLIFAKKNRSFQDMRFIIRRLLIILVSFLIEGFIFGVNFFPFEVATVAIIYFMDKHLSQKQIAILQNIVHTLNRKPV